MKITKIDKRYLANKRYGYNFAVAFHHFDFNAYYGLKKVAHSMFGDSRNITNRWAFKEDIVRLKTGAWAYRWIRSGKPMELYFRDESEMNQVVMMYALTKS